MLREKIKQKIGPKKKKKTHYLPAHTTSIKSSRTLSCATVVMDLFERLPLEISRFVLSHVDSPQDFYSLICASPICFRIFCCDKEYYLSTVLHQCYGRANLILGLRILKAGKILVNPPTQQKPYLQFETPDGTDRPEWIAKHVGRHIKETRLNLHEDPLSEPCIAEAGERTKEEEQQERQSARKSAEPQEKPVEKSTRLRQLCRLWRLVDYFIEDYSRQATKHVKRIRLNSASEKVQISPLDSWAIFRHGLSRQEYNRIQRAFLYFELYRRLYSGLEPYISPEEENDEGIGDINTEQAQFSALLTGCENVELGSVHDHLAMRMGQVFRRVWNYVDSRRDVIDGASALNANGDGKNDIVREKELRLLWRLQALFDDTDLKSPETAAFLVEFGLPFCQRFFSMPVSKQASIIHRCRVSQRHSSLAHVIIMERPDWGGTHFEDKYGNDKHPSHFPRANSYGWNSWWALDSDPTSDPDTEPGPSSDFTQHSSKAIYGLGLTGYFFWDRQRLQGLMDVGEHEWPLRVGCALFDEMCRSGFEHRVGLSWYFNMSDDDDHPYFEEYEDRRCAPVPPLRPGEEVLGLADVEDGCEDKDDGDGGDVDDFARAKNMPVQAMAPSKIELEIDSFDY